MRKVRGQCGSLHGPQGRNGFYRKEDSNGLEVAMGSKHDADSIFWSERHEMYEKEPIPLRGLRLGVVSSRGNGSTSPGFKKGIEVHRRG